MPKTEEEWQAEIESLNRKHEAEMTGKDTIITNLEANAVASQKAHAEVKSKLARFEKAEREAAVEEFHAITKGFSDERKKLLPDITKWENSQIIEFNALAQGVIEAHAVPQSEHRSTPPGSGGSESSPNSFLDR